MPAPDGFNYGYIKLGRDLWPEDSAFQQLDDLFWRNVRRRYVLLRGDTSSGKSTILNILVGSKLLHTAEAQATSCITEIRAIPDDDRADLTRRIVLLDWAGVEARLQELEKLGDPDIGAYRKAADEVKGALARRGLKFGVTMELDHWNELGFGTSLSDKQRHSVVVIDRIIIPVQPGGPGSDAAMRWAADSNISFLDLPGDAQGNHIVAVVLAEAERRYVPVVKLRIWGAHRPDAPDSTASEVLVINQLDMVRPDDGQAITVERTARAHPGPLIVMSAAADAPEDLDLGIPVSKGDAQARLRTWVRSLDEQPKDHPSQGAALLAALRTTMARPDGGVGVLVDAIDSAVRDNDAEPPADEAIASEAAAMLDRLRQLRDGLGSAPTERDAELELRLRAEEEQQRIEDSAKEVATRAVYGAPGAPPWPELLQRTGAVHPLDVLRVHLTAAEEQARAELNMAGGPVLVHVAEPVLDRLARLSAGPSRSAGGSRLSWVDVARIRWEFAAILADHLISELDRSGTPEPKVDRADVAARAADYNRRAFVINAAIGWASALASGPARP